MSKSLQFQRATTTVLAACLFPLLPGIYCFGWRVLACVLFSNVCCAVTEYLFLRKSGKPVTKAAFVTGTILALMSSPNIPFWMEGKPISFQHLIYVGDFMKKPSFQMETEKK